MSADRSAHRFTPQILDLGKPGTPNAPSRPFIASLGRAMSRKMQTIRTSATRARFLDALSEFGNVTQSCLAANVGRAAMYAWKAQDPEFSDAWDEALVLGVNGLEDKALDYAIAGNDKLIMFLLASRRPEVYQPRQLLEVNHHHTVSLRRVPLDTLRAELAGLMGDQPGRPVVTIEGQEATVVEFPKPV